MNQKPKIIVIVGPTAMGKSDIGVELAKKFGGEIISADSRQVYRGLDIGTGKITKKEMRGVPHHLLDISSPRRQLTVTEYKEKADYVIKDILARKKVPILVGGTGFYIQAVIDNITLPDVPPDPHLRKELAEKDTQTLSAMLRQHDRRRFNEIEPNDRKRVIRALEIVMHLGKVPKQTKPKPLYDVLFIGLDIPTEDLRTKIVTRLTKRIKQGMLKEIQNLHEKGLSWKRMENLGLEYRYGSRYVRGQISKTEFFETLSTKIWQYAKRQRTWFRRDKRIKWFKPSEVKKVEKEVKTFLAI